MSSIKNNPAAVLTAFAQLAQSSQTSGSKGSGGKLSPENAAQLLQTLTQLAGALQKLQKGLNGDGFGSEGAGKGGGAGDAKGAGGGGKSGGAGDAKGAGGAGGSEGAGKSGSPLEQLASLLKTLLEAMDPKKGEQGKGDAGGAGKGGGAGDSKGAGGAGGGAGDAKGAGDAGGMGQPMSLMDAVTALSNLKQEQGALMDKISEGVKSGKITPKELGPLMQGVQDLAKATKEASADGQITAGEAANLAQMSLKNALNTKSAFENNSKADFAALNPATQKQAEQLGDISKGLMDGSIGNGELADLANDQGQISDALDNVSSADDAQKVLTAQQLVGLEAQLARLSKVNG